MRILTVSNYETLVSPKVEALLLLELQKRGLYIEVITGKPSVHTLAFEQAGIRVHHHTHPRSKIDLTAIRYIRKHLINGHFDILHLFTGRGASNGTLAAMGLPVKVITYRGAGDLYWHDPTAWLSHLNPRVDHISCLSEYVKRQVDRQFFLRPKKTSVQYKAFPAEWFEKPEPARRSTLGIPHDAILVGSVANYRKVKGIESLIRATHKLAGDKRIWLILAGRGMDGAPLDKLIARSPMKERILALGFRDDVFNLVKACDIYVQPSLNEGLSKSVMEAIMLEVPCVITNAGGMPELIDHGKSGWICPVNDPRALADAISILANDLPLRQHLATQARIDLLARFSINKYVESTLEMYRLVLSQKIISQ